MQIYYHKSFKKSYKKLPKNVQLAFKKRVVLFKLDSFHPLLSNHALSGKHSGCRSINITGDYRAIYIHYIQTGDVIEFLQIGTHAQLYG
jgi:addiction module RelE/StbE family toxin